MAELAPDCAALREVAAELALGTLEGSDRGTALAHLASCPACRVHVKELTETADRLLALAPEAEPPPGFESAVIDRIATERNPVDAGRRRPPRLLVAAAALVLVVTGLVTGFLLASGPADGGGELASAAMLAPGGDSVGEVWRYGDDDATLFVSVPAWADVEGTDGPRYALRLQLDDGGTVEVGDFGLGGGSSSWGLTAPVAAESIAAVSVVDETGRVWCTGHFAREADADR